MPAQKASPAAVQSQLQPAANAPVPAATGPIPVVARSKARAPAPAPEQAPPPEPSAQPPAGPQPAVTEPVPPPGVPGVALKSGRAKPGRPAQASGTAQAGRQAARTATYAPEAAPPPSAARQAAAAAKPAPRAAKAKQFPEGFHPAIDGLGYRLEFGRDPVAGLDAYRVTVEGKDVGWLRREQEKRWVLYSTVDAFTESVHRNVLGAQARLETISEPAD